MSQHCVGQTPRAALLIALTVGVLVCLVREVQTQTVVQVSATAGVDTTGCGTVLKPCASLRGALTRLGPSPVGASFIYFAGGTYSGANNTNISIRLSNICLIGQETVTFAGDINVRAWTMDLVSNIVVSNIVFSGFTTTNLGSFIGAVTITRSAAIVFRDCAFVSNVGGFAGAVYVGTSSVSFSECLFQYCLAVSAGGSGIYADNGILSITGSTFDNNAASNGGTTVFISTGNGTIAGSVFSRNSVNGNGGAVYAASGPFVFTDCIFTANQARDAGLIVSKGWGSGGAVALEANANFTFTNCTFTRNNGNGAGGAVATGTALVLFWRCSFYGNSDYETGGAVAVNSATSVFYDCLFDRNNAISSKISVGGAIWVNFGAGITISNCNFTGNAAHSGGAIYIQSEAAQLIVNSTFEFNQADGPTSILSYGGAIYGANASPTIVNCRFVGNRAALISNNGGFGGGALYIFRGAFVVYTSTFLSNTGENGGHVYVDGSSPSKFTDCFFEGGSAGNGGAVLFPYGAVGIFTNCTFQRNTASVGGGAVGGGSGSHTFTNCSFISNMNAGVTDAGGALSLLGGSSVVTDCSFYNNTGSYGGGLYVASGSPTLSACSFSTNRGIVAGGGVYISGGTPYFPYCRFYANRGGMGGAAYIASGASPVFFLTLFLDNTGSAGNYGDGYGSVYAADGSHALFENCTFATSPPAAPSGSALAWIAAPVLVFVVLVVLGVGVYLFRRQKLASSDLPKASTIPDYRGLPASPAASSNSLGVDVRVVPSESGGQHINPLYTAGRREHHVISA